MVERQVKVCSPQNISGADEDDVGVVLKYWKPTEKQKQNGFVQFVWCLPSLLKPIGPKCLWKDVITTLDLQWGL